MEQCKHAAHFHRSLREYQIQCCGIRIIQQDIIHYCAGEIIEDLGEENLRVPSPASFSKGRSNSLAVSFICWNGLRGYKCHVLGADRIAGGSGKS
jgi:hypothetical protein